MEEVLLFNKFFSHCRYMPYLRRYSPTKLCDGVEMAIFLRPLFSASRVQYISDLHSKFALRPHHALRGSIVDIQSATAEIRWGNKKEERRRWRKRSIWTRRWIEQREKHGTYYSPVTKRNVNKQQLTNQRSAFSETCCTD